MIKDLIISIVQYILLILFQVLILDNISLWGFCTPFVYIWFVVLLPYNTSRWLLLLSSFLLGVGIDIFAGQTGVHAFSSTFIGFVRPYILGMYSGTIENTSQRPSISRLGFANYLSYSFILVFLHHFLCFLIGVFSFSEILHILLRCIVSVIVTMIIIIVLDTIFYRKKA